MSSNDNRLFQADMSFLSVDGRLNQLRDQVEPGSYQVPAMAIDPAVLALSRFGDAVFGYYQTVTVRENDPFARVSLALTDRTVAEYYFRVYRDEMLKIGEILFLGGLLGRTQVERLYLTWSLEPVMVSAERITTGQTIFFSPFPRSDKSIVNLYIPDNLT